MSLYHKIAEHLGRQIADGTFNIGALLPAEHYLAGLHKVSRTTIRQALQILELQGKVRRERGRGTIVSSKLVRHLDPRRSFEYDMRSQGIEVETRVVDRRLVIPPPEIRSRLGLSNRDRVLLVCETRHIAGRPCSLTERYIHPKYRSLYLEERRQGTTMYEILAQREGRRTYSEMAIEVVPALFPRAELLRVKAGTLVLVDRFVDYIERREPLEIVDAYYPIDRWTFVFKRWAVVESMPGRFSQSERMRRARGPD